MPERSPLRGIYLSSETSRSHLLNHGFIRDGLSDGISLDFNSKLDDINEDCDFLVFTDDDREAFEATTQYFKGQVSKTPIVIYAGSEKEKESVEKYAKDNEIDLRYLASKEMTDEEIFAFLEATMSIAPVLTEINRIIDEISANSNLSRPRP